MIISHENLRMLAKDILIAAGSIGDEPQLVSDNLVDANLAGHDSHGIGMLPRGEVALIMAGIGISQGIIGSDLFSVSIIMTIVTTVLAPLVLSRSFSSAASGARVEKLS